MMKVLKKRKTKRIISLIIVTALIAGLFFFPIKVNATEYLPEAGFEEFLDELDVLSDDKSEYIFYETPIEPIYILSDYEAMLLLEIGVLEGGETDPTGIAHVMQVVMNRVNSDEFPNTVEEVIYQTNPVQFPTTKSLSSANITPAAYEALDAVIFGDYVSNKCVFFESLEGLAFASWADYSFSYWGHDFYM